MNGHQVEPDGWDKLPTLGEKPLTWCGLGRVALAYAILFVAVAAGLALLVS